MKNRVKITKESQFNFVLSFGKLQFSQLQDRFMKQFTCSSIDGATCKETNQNIYVC